MGNKVSGYLIRGKVPRSQEKKFKGNWMGGVECSSVVKPNTNHLGYETVMWFCRDQFVPSFVRMLQAFNEVYPEVSLSSQGSTAKIESDIIIHKQLTLALLGDTNREFSAIASPFILRWVIGYLRAMAFDSTRKPYFVKELGRTEDVERIREVIRANRRWGYTDPWFYDLMVLADTEGIKLNPNMREAWFTHMTPMYAMAGLSHLKRRIKSNTAPHTKEKYDYELAFPPSVLLRQAVKDE